jgi:hypothetical protein
MDGLGLDDGVRMHATTPAAAPWSVRACGRGARHGRVGGKPHVSDLLRVARPGLA